MIGPFAHVHTLGFAPPIYKLWRKAPVNTDTPHALAPRSYGVSVLRAFFWMAYNLSGYVSLRWAKARSTLVLNDRHFVDILVDPVRYRYGGPRWLLKFIWRLMPKPDAIILLNAPPEVLQARKQELTLDETRRQCREYLALVRQQKERTRDRCGAIARTRDARRHGDNLRQTIAHDHLIGPGARPRDAGSEAGGRPGSSCFFLQPAGKTRSSATARAAERSSAAIEGRLKLPQVNLDWI